MNINYKGIENGNILFLKDLCNKLMKFQADNATILPEVMASMNFENRLLPDFANAKNKVIFVAYDGNKAVGFAYANTSVVESGDVQVKPSWADALTGLGFYPQDYKTPKQIGTFKLLYVDSNYRGLNIGAKLSELTMDWLRIQEGVEDLWVYVANGNEKVGLFYEKYGFEHSHKVFNGFIEAYIQSI